ncbi:MAG: carboxyl-terminal protease, carboxyl-terminal processing protease [Candidatus Peregrinibacteria bacterium GW2011_GWF2_33_10]|nr:MAG: carboxyl-terminal protease, carboxyl-terminal processing protease [Candidatus Peregrinibacteria bacterium GW2011_GWF2_33_10]OGJ45065.1 MAG: hypothetical protein A2263_02415 [Candidatus Peregrinibacteria bacterium RIFOXYA2_FULL_33_21]OGJ46058.1 MAG: hypothetical protein A2272_02060 [Candidatus Peregrinibacteria bacterium RIFOXYA12_FULL_33_12]OGJ50851.1 MAG: hypothetical protein A2307_00640 [Candidatus Peregrinibacteria bacterium RIFOXYB2_FULL_33_20]
MPKFIKIFAIFVLVLFIECNAGVVLAYDETQANSAAQYLETACLDTSIVSTIKDQKTIKRIDAVTYLINLISSCDNSKLQTYVNTELPYQDLNDLTDDELVALKTAYALQTVDDGQYFLPNRFVNRLDLLKMSLKLYGIPANPLFTDSEADFFDLSNANDQAYAKIGVKIGFPLEQASQFLPNKWLDGAEYLIWIAKIDEFAKGLLGAGASQEEIFAEPDGTAISDRNIKDIVEFWNLIKKYLVSPLDKKIDYTALEEKMMESFFKQLNETVDPYAYYVPASEAPLTKQEAYGGIGASLGINDNQQIYIDTVFPDTPAEKAGLEPLDVVLKVDNTKIENMTTTDVSFLIRGEEGTTVSLTIYRSSDKKQHVYNIVREIINLSYVDSTVTKYNGEYYLYSKILTFNSIGVINTFQEHLNEVLASDYKIKGIIIDLRGNGGGYVSEAIQLIELFLGKGNTAFSFQYSDGSKEVYKTKNEALTILPVVILVNDSSASASEIVALAMQGNKRAEIIGEKTYGKFVAQQVFTLDKTTKAEIRFTIAKWYGPNDTLAPVTPDEIVDGEENQLMAGYKWLDEEK